MADCFEETQMLSTQAEHFVKSQEMLSQNNVIHTQTNYWQNVTSLLLICVCASSTTASST